ncbi:MAG: hypothetical protein KGD68_10305 [Candidatus Lokiarchaeota archaeon]|nr:hypothetical protein [Candidatus Lokiarchaeota archaeon]
MRINHLIKLVSEAADGKENFKEGVIGFNNYGFIFRNFDYISKNSFIIGDGSSKLCSIGAFKDIYRKSLELQGPLKSPKDLLNYNPKHDLYFGGALRTLVPNMKFGGYESLFHVWMFVKTPKSQMFPATFYYGQSGTSIGAWSPDYRVFLFAEERTFPQEFESNMNFTPFNFSAVELEEFIEALELALYKVPISDFEGVYEHDLGRELMGIKSGKPFVKTLEKERKEIETWSYSIKGNDEASNLNSDFIDIMIDQLTPEENKKYPRNIPESMDAILIERAYDQLIAHAYMKKSRLAFMVLGVFLMLHGSKITEGLSQTILKYSDWEYEKDQLKNEKDRDERKRFLDDFREKIKNYNGTKVVKVPFYSVTRVLNEKREKGDTTPIWRQNIDYSIKASPD